MYTYNTDRQKHTHAYIHTGGQAGYSPPPPLTVIHSGNMSLRAMLSFDKYKQLLNTTTNGH